ncbi:SMI1/KNR4 family protein [Rhodococcus maanshanensis]|uniref:SMI1-KNR4 cell-wall n=1 Tax=Rhodococcus maanshanensis TaxID=183556 RepID=A0A1H7R368_9NOCA|nr:SMI1/KNR4 family protein [Rhodococcus maanshanensis]SEL54602.1 SMI1-KNR4 cell-wall [Rhodococcus maanshanensis]
MSVEDIGSVEPDSRRTDGVPRTTGHFDGLDFDGFWDGGDYSRENYVEPVPTDDLIASIEKELGGYRLPDSYVELMRLHNGGMVERPCHPMDEPTNWAENHIQISGLYAIGRTATWSLCGELGSTFMREEWGYPDIGVGIADTPSAGHEQVMLDYRACGPRGEPRVVHVDQEADYRITPIAPDFATFVRGLVSEDEFDDSAEMKEADLAAVRHGTLSPIVRRALEAADLQDGEALLRALAERIVTEKGFFALHADGDSWLMYDVMFWLYSHLATATSFEDFVHRAEGQIDYGRPCYTLMVTTSFVADPYGFCTGGYAEGFLRDWWDAKVERGNLIAADGGYRFDPEYATQLLRVLRATGG